jgi:3-dehydroquinate synthase
VWILPLSEIQKIEVELGERSYPIVIGAGLLRGDFDLSSYLTGPDCVVVSNETVAPLYLDAVRKLLGNDNVRSVTLPDGEQYKTLGTAEKILDELVDGRAGRDVTVVALGGGVVGDISGFAAACYMRGVYFIQIPTTLLAQVDSSVGGKTGVNHVGGKNLIGAFHQPRLVLIDTETLDTLPDRELKAGLAEVIKHGAIADVAYFSWLEDNMPRLLARDADCLVHAIQRSCEIKAAVVAEDEREQGRRAILNFGHTFGHAIENSLGYGEWLHGEAVAAGMVMAAMLSGLDAASLERLKNLIAAAGLPTSPPDIDAAKLATAMQLDKKVTAGKLRFVLLKNIGDAYVTNDYQAPLLDEILASASSEQQ